MVFFEEINFLSQKSINLDYFNIFYHSFQRETLQQKDGFVFILKIAD